MGRLIQMEPASLRRIKKPLTFGGKSGKQLFDLGLKFDNAGEDNVALYYYRAAMDAGYESIHLWINIGMIYGEMDTPESLEHARYCFSLALDMDRGNPLANFGMGLALELLGDFEKAKSYYVFALEMEPDFYNCHLGLGIIYTRERDYPLAVSHWDAYIESAQDDEWLSFAKEQRRKCTTVVVMKKKG